MWLWALTASAQTAYDIPSHVLQGTALRVVVKNPSAGKLTAKLLDKSVPLFRQDSGEWLRLMPVPVAPPPGEMDAVRALQASLTEARHWAEPFLNPTGDCMNSLFGVQRYHNGKPTGGYHRGVDLRSPMGRPVEATAAGVVRISRMFQLHGGTVGIDHGQGMTSLYLHLSKLAVPEGTQVRKGEVVGY